MTDSLLSPYQVLDLTDKNGHFCSKILADLGADVIKIEPPGGDPARNVGPFYRDRPHPEHSLTWWAYNTNKRSITLNIESPGDKDKFRQMASRTHFVIESFPPGFLDNIGLGYSTLRQLNPGLILISITPFGQTGPYKDLKASDIVLMAMGGQMFSAGDPDRPPVRISVPQAYQLACAHGAAASMIALNYRLRTGQGQHVDVSAQAAVARLLAIEYSIWEFNKELSQREGALRPLGNGLKFRLVWPCKDGTVTFRFGIGGHLRGVLPLVSWMVSEGKAGLLEKVNWEALRKPTTITKEIESWQSIFADFFLCHTKTELYEGALQRHIPLFPVSNLTDIIHDHQLEARNHWVTVEHPELGSSFTYPGSPTRISLTPWQIKSRAPLPGEHNQEVFSELEATALHNKTNESTVSKPNQLKELNQPNKLNDKALEGLKVLDFTWFLAGTLVTKYLADFGAQVLKIESPSNFDQTRASPPFKDGKPGLNRSASFRFYNSSKKSVSINLSNPRGKDIVLKLAKWADVVVENFTPGVIARLGFDYDTLRQVNPKLIMLSTTNQGQSGPHSKHPGFGWNLSGLGGFNHFSGWPDREGVEPNAAYNDFATPWFAVVAILGALDYQKRTGKGQYIDLSQYEAGLSYLSVPILDYTVNGREGTRQGNYSNHACPHGAYPCRGEDRWCVISVLTEPEWKIFCTTIGNPHWASDIRFNSFESRKKHEEEMDRLISAWTLEHFAEDIMARLQKAGLAAGVVQNARDLLEKDPQLQHRGFFQRLNHPDMGMVYHMGWPVEFSHTPYQLTCAPLLGEHTELVCREILKLSEDEIKELKAAGAFD
ncbi:MAG: CoA transferase [Dehalococcoidia bacterium]|nr:CoA transferase [Dehalococcoidia bacterium]